MILVQQITLIQNILIDLLILRLVSVWHWHCSKECVSCGISVLFLRYRQEYNCHITFNKLAIITSSSLTQNINVITHCVDSMLMNVAWAISFFKLITCSCDCVVTYHILPISYVMRYYLGFYLFNLPFAAVSNSLYLGHTLYLKYFYESMLVKIFQWCVSKFF